LDNPESRDELRLLKDENDDMLVGNEVDTLAELTLDVEPVGLESTGGRPELLDFCLVVVLLLDIPLKPANALV